MAFRISFRGTHNHDRTIGGPLCWTQYLCTSKLYNGNAIRETFHLGPADVSALPEPLRVGNAIEPALDGAVAIDQSDFDAL